MWKVFLAFVTHRLFLFMVAVLTLQSAGPTSGSRTDQFLRRVSKGAEATRIQKLVAEDFATVLSQSRNPFHWLVVLFCHSTGLSPLMALLILSNLFFLLFLNELFSLFNRMVTTDISTIAAIFVVLWPTSYEISLGASLAFACFLVTVSLRQALEQRWWASGVCAGILAFIEPIALLLLPAFLYLFWSVQRFLPSSQWARNLGFFFGPLAVGALFSGVGVFKILDVVDQSALFNLVQWEGPQGEGLFSQSLAGQTVTLIFFFLGAVGALFSNINPMHRFLPLLVFLGLLLSVPYPVIASRALLAAICMEGVASSSSGTAGRIVGSLMLLLGAYEVYSVFS